MTEDLEEMLTVPEVAKIFGVTPYTIRAWIKDNLLPAQKNVGGHYWRVKQSEVIKLANKKYGDPNDKQQD